MQPVPGQWQTIARAELFAFVSALLIGTGIQTESNCAFAAWSDCEFVIKRARAIQHGLFAASTTTAAHDLWQIVQHILPDESRCRLHHIKSHQSYRDEEAWACSANEMSDHTAAMALACLPAPIRQAQLAAREAYVRNLTAIQQVHKRMVRVAKFWVESQPSPKSAPVRPVDHLTVINWKHVAIAAADKAGYNLRYDRFATLLIVQTVQYEVVL